MEEWFEIPRVFIILGVVWTLVTAWGLVRRWRKGFWKLGFKEAFQSIVLLGGLVWVLYFIVTSLVLLVPLSGWLTVYAESGEWSGDALWILNSIPIFCAATIPLAAFLFLGLVWRYKPGYSEKEKTLLREEKLRWKKRLGWFGRLIKVD